MNPQARRRPPARLAEILESSYVRLAIAVVLVALGYSLLTLYFINTYTERLYDVRKEELRRIVELGLAAVDPLRGPNADENLSMEQARREGAILIRDLTSRYRLGENYLIMGTTSGLMLVHPYHPELEFSNQWNITDANGKPFMQEMIALAASDEGSGYLEYYYPPPNSDTPQRKVTYVVAIPEWDAFIAAGMYMDEVDAANRRYMRDSLLIMGGLLVVIFVFIYATLRPTLRTYGTLFTLFEEVHDNPDAIPNVPLESFREGSEGRDLLDGFHSMLQQIDLSKRARQEAVLTERNRLARELHDAVSQTLFSATIIADVLPRLWERDEDLGRERLEELRELTRGALAEMRTLLNELRPSALVQTDFDDLLRQLSEAVIARARLPIELHIEGEFDPPPDVKIALYRIAQEALNNVVKHAYAGQASIVLKANEAGAELCISDDGRGFDPAAVTSDHLGLNIMRERAEAIGARLTIDSQPGEGTEIVVAWHP